MGFRQPLTRLSELIADTITGAIIRTAETGNRVEIGANQTTPSSIEFYPDLAVTEPGAVESGYSDGLGHTRAWTQIWSPMIGVGHRGFIRVGKYLFNGVDRGSYVNIECDDMQFTANEALIIRTQTGFDLDAGAGTIALASVGGTTNAGPFTATGRSYGLTETLAQAVFGGWSGACTLHRQGKVVTFHINITATVAKNGNDLAGELPAGWRPAGGRKYFDALDSATGNRCPMWVDPNGQFAHVFARAAGEGTLGYITFVCP